jgi:hypothetical protein
LTHVNTGPLERGKSCAPSRSARRKELSMMDVIMLAIGFGLFAVSVGYTIACDRL